MSLVTGGPKDGIRKNKSEYETKLIAIYNLGMTGEGCFLEAIMGNRYK